MTARTSSKIKLLFIVLATAFVQLMSAAVAQAACKPCTKLNELAKASVKAKGDEAVKIIAESNVVFQDVVHAQPKLDASTAYDMLAVAIHLLDEDPNFIVLENLSPYYEQYKDIFNEQLKRFRPKEAIEFRKRMKELKDSEAQHGNG